MDQAYERAEQRAAENMGQTEITTRRPGERIPTNKPVSPLIEAIGRVRQCTRRVYEINDRAAALRMELLGAVQEGVTSSPSPEPSCVLEEMHFTVNELEIAIDQLRGNISALCELGP